MRNEVVRLPRRGSAQGPRHWYGNASSKRRITNAASSVVVLFPGPSPILQGRVRDTPADPEAVKMLAALEQENAELRRHVVDLALEIQELRAGPTDRHKLDSTPA